jgi:hypothetical protein
MSAAHDLRYRLVAPDEETTHLFAARQIRDVFPALLGWHHAEDDAL